MKRFGPLTFALIAVVVLSCSGTGENSVAAQNNANAANGMSENTATIPAFLTGDDVSNHAVTLNQEGGAIDYERIPLKSLAVVIEGKTYELNGTIPEGSVHIGRDRKTNAMCLILEDGVFDGNRLSFSLDTGESRQIVEFTCYNTTSSH